MVIEVVSWPGAAKTHAINQHEPSKTLCGVWFRLRPYRIAEYDEHAEPTCLRCLLAVMKS